MTGYMDAHEALDKLIRGGEGGGRALLVAGAPQSGKTGFAHDALLRGLDAFGDARAVMAVANRVVADKLGDEVIRRIGASAQVRPVTTLAALAFRVIADDRFASGSPAPRLLNGAEQDALLRGVLAGHVAHAESGDVCGTCMLLRDYFATEDWASSMGAFPSDEEDASRSGGVPTAALLERGVSAEFVGQLRDMLARMDEVGASADREEELLLALEASAGEGRDTRVERLRVQWRLAFALRREYVAAVAAAYPGEYRLDSSRLLVEAADVLHRGGGQVPELLVVDDFQDVTLAAMRFLEAAAGRGARLVLVGDPDEAVQTFRGSYPEYLFARAVDGPIAAGTAVLNMGSAVRAGAGAATPSYRDVVAARVSLSIPSPLEDPVPLPERPWKLPRHEGAWPIRRLDGASPLPADGSLRCALYRSPREELDDVVWRIKHEHLDGLVSWNDMAVIAHDNGTVRLFGERLRRDGVPVRYSSVTRPLNEEPFVRGLFALIELARLRGRGLAGAGMDPRSLAAYARARVVALMTSPLITIGSTPGEGVPGRMEPIEAAMRSLESLARIVTDTDHTDHDDDAEGALSGLVASWRALVAAWPGNDDVRVDDSLLGNPEPTAAAPAADGSDASGDAPAFGLGPQYAMLAVDDPRAPAMRVLAVINQVLGADPQARAFIRLWTLVGKVAAALDRLESDEPQFALAAAWDAVGVARAWQRRALDNTPEGRAANDRLDVAMRLFQYAEGGTAGHDIAAFIAQMRSMQIEADSLARVKPVEQAVTLTTPAGAAGRHWRHVWMPAVQQDVWPNLAERNTMFGGEDLADIILRGPDAHAAWAAAPAQGTRLGEVLAGEKKSFLYALTRAAGPTPKDCTVTVSAVSSDDLTPSDFLYGYLPECFGRTDKPSFSEVGRGGMEAPTGEDSTTDMESDTLAGLDCDPRGLVAAARIILARHPADAPQARDAAAALALLAGHGVTAADPDEWAYLHTAERSGNEVPDMTATPDAAAETDTPDAPDAAADAPVVSLSPSAVDRLWECPVCWLLENRFAGPRPGSAATGFGTLIHAVAQQGSEEGLDLPGFMADATREERLEAVTGRLVAIYDGLKPDPADIDDPAARYAAIRKDEQAQATLANLAAYFVRSGMPGYLGANDGKFDVGSLDRVSCEEEFAARFGLDDILAAYHAVPGVEPVTRHDLMAMMGVLVGGWPEGMREDLTIRLTGRIDRKETRVMADGSRAVRLIDYKTGQVPSTRQRFNDLQLVCYQLGLAFPETDDRRGRHAVCRPLDAPAVAQSALFHVEAHETPAQSFAPEGLFQPPLFTGGSLNVEPFTQRFHYRDPAKLMDVPAIPAEAPQGVDPRAWERFAALQGTQTMWALAMIARVFYAASASISAHLTARPTAQHLAYCRMRTVCPACAGQVDTVYETRQA
ncbi:PD-(D/E)XK nuclease superfamily [Bifidobacterium parmae]|uniref:DNA 3'-5' helicase n=2 Tax=Bifidobacterium parmae TaxID=361854 RepID=A0A2N5IZU1_9BIFI|nr:PD-(D/E)XK nuclease superfamily [Bifidobacterium parmae]